MRDNALSKKQCARKRLRLGVTGHAEGKGKGKHHRPMYICNCLWRKFHLWLGKKYYGVTTDDELREATKNDIKNS